ncbi:MAG: 2-oxoglutarate oxidoreductase [Syntrophobacterales bacterium CG_4_8_14_3_um_filter_49_14]|nr:MAG: 2-oxoglutarate oxidoreductase [Syntrophobacterales bacterium CG23_combo_of_CG06-09_8_20_14_all_48_27]PJC74638.1 MAG: 2-oxoglutarate oxidoreductase [Syntrophobacterales bacterium CG_4_8_14_3_um_filter_49_14]
MVKKVVCGKPRLWRYRSTSLPFCPGCQHGVGARAVLETVEELGIEGKTIFLGGGGCAYPLPSLLDLDAMQCPNGRATSIGSAMKRLHGGETVIITYQDDNDALAVGTEPLIHAALRGDAITVILANNAGYGSTGWQMASPGDTPVPPEMDKPNPLFPINIMELLAEFEGVSYLARGTVSSANDFEETKGYIKTAIAKQMAGAGFNLVEILTACPARWHLTPQESLKWIREEMVAGLPLGEFKNGGGN